MEFANRVLNEARADYKNNYVIYPLPMNEDLKSLTEAYRLILISVEASPFIRYERAMKKYQISDLETFMQIDHAF